MEIRGTRTQIVVGVQDYAHQIFGKNPKVFHQPRGTLWTSQDALSILNAILSMPGRCACLHGVELTALREDDIPYICVGDSFLQIAGDRRENMALRKTVLVVEAVEGDWPNNRRFRTKKIWPVSVNWGCDTVQRPLDFFQPGLHFPTLYFGFRVTNEACYNFEGNPKYEAAAAKAREFIALTECFLLALHPDVKADALDPSEDYGNAMYIRGQDFRRAFYTLRSVLLDKTLQGFAGLCNDKQDHLMPLMTAMQAMVHKTITETACKLGTENEADAPVFKAILDEQAGSSSVADRLCALFNPDHCGSRDHWSLYNRLGIMHLLAANLNRNTRAANLLVEMLRANLPILKTDMTGLTVASLDSYFKW